MPTHPRTYLRWGALAVLLAAGLAGALLFASAGSDARFATREAPGGAQGAGGWDVMLAPTGTVHFDHVPRTVATLDANYDDLLVAIDEESRQIADGYPGNVVEVFHAALPGVEVAVDRTKLRHLGGGGLDKETLYALGAEVHHIDPTQLLAGSRWRPADIEEIARNVGPFVANRYSREHSGPADGEYTYYSLWALSERVAQVYRRDAAVRALQREWDAMVERIHARLPPESERPTVGLLMYGKGKFTAFSLSREGFGTAHLRAVGARDAFAGIRHLTYADAGAAPTLDVEAILAIDPEVIVMPFAVAPSMAARFDEFRALAQDPLAGRLRAFRTGRVHPGGTPLQGPVALLFQTEMAAKQLYPDRFGVFRPEHDYPPAERLFDRERVAAVLRRTEAPCALPARPGAWRF